MNLVNIMARKNKHNQVVYLLVWFILLTINLIHRTICTFNMNLRP